MLCCFCKMYSVRLVVYVENNVWDMVYITRNICSTSDCAFISLKKSFKNKSYGNNFTIIKCPKCRIHCDCKKDSTLNDQDLNIFDVKWTENRYICLNDVNSEGVSTKENVVLEMNGYELSVIFLCLLNSSVFRRRVIRNFKSLIIIRDGKTISLAIQLVPPTRHILDYAWAKRMELLAIERMELNTTMSWLSTLGGAFSALGEEKTSCAGMAGRISVHQFKIALRLGDLLTVSRCKLYLALSMIQRGRLKAAKKIIYEQYIHAKSIPDDAKDIRLIRMCQGLWAKLKYAFKLRQQMKIQGSLRNVEP